MKVKGKDLWDETEWHSVLLDGKYVHADALVRFYEELKELVPPRLHSELKDEFETFMEDLHESDVSFRYQEKRK